MWLQKTRKTGRNDPCPCGSGKKYKKCCLTEGLGQDPFHIPETDACEAGFWNINKANVFVGYATELLTLAPTHNDQELAIEVALTAWNLAVLNEGGGCGEIIDSLFNIKEEDGEDFSDAILLMEMLINKKNREYPQFKWLIFGFELTETEHSFELEIMASERIAC